MKTSKEFKEMIRFEYEEKDMVFKQSAKRYEDTEDYVIARLLLVKKFGEMYEQELKVNTFSDEDNPFYEFYCRGAQEYVDYGTELSSKLEIKYDLIESMKHEMEFDLETSQFHPNMDEKEVKISLKHLENYHYHNFTLAGGRAFAMTDEDIYSLIDSVYTKQEWDMVIDMSELNIAVSANGDMIVEMLYYTDNELVTEAVKQAFITIQTQCQLKLTTGVL